MMKHGNRKTFIYIAILLMLLSVQLAFAAPLKKSVVTTFTASKHCFVGFSNKKVSNCIQLREDETVTTYNGLRPVKFTFYADDPIVSTNPSESPGVYISDLFYAYCQSFSREPLTVTLTASDFLVCQNPEALQNANKNTNITYELVDQSSLIDNVTSKAWSGKKSITIQESAPTTGKFTEPRVVMSQPILIKVYSKLVKNGQVIHEVEGNNSYHATFTLKVSTVE